MSGDIYSDETPEKFLARVEKQLPQIREENPEEAERLTKTIAELRQGRMEIKDFHRRIRQDAPGLRQYGVYD